MSKAASKEIVKKLEEHFPSIAPALIRHDIIPYLWQLTVAITDSVKEIIALVVDCGCGKTLAGMLLAIKKQMPVIIIAPTHRLCDQWRSDLEKIMGDEADVWVYSKPEETRQGKQYQERFEKWLTA